MSTFKIDPNILGWIECFLSNRTQYVIANNHTSSPCSVESGVPQGSVLGTLLFLIYVNDLPDNINSSIKLFADDCVIYREINNPNDTLVLQSELNKVSEWCNNLTLNISKCKYMTFSRSTNASMSSELMASDWSACLHTSISVFTYLTTCHGILALTTSLVMQIALSVISTAIFSKLRSA